MSDKKNQNQSSVPLRDGNSSPSTGKKEWAINEDNSYSRRDTTVTNSFAPPVRTGDGGNNGEQKSK
ncbi:TPA: hypothetical protein P7B99_002400 [Escherichia coli]|nr:hypothetical protein [Escherichia coli]